MTQSQSGKFRQSIQSGQFRQSRQSGKFIIHSSPYAFFIIIAVLEHVWRIQIQMYPKTYGACYSIRVSGQTELKSSSPFSKQHFNVCLFSNQEDKFLVLVEIL